MARALGKESIKIVPPVKKDVSGWKQELFHTSFAITTMIAPPACTTMQCRQKVARQKESMEMKPVGAPPES